MHGFCDNQTTDTHETKKQAEAVCRMLEKDGLGGGRLWFPIKTKVEEIEDAPQENAETASTDKQQPQECNAVKS